MRRVAEQTRQGDRKLHRAAQVVDEASLYRRCTSKVRFADKGPALLKAGSLGEAQGKVLRVYFCKLCRGWHLTSKEQG